MANVTRNEGFGGVHRLPVMVDLSGSACAVIGAGPVAAERAAQICSAGGRPRVIARDVSTAMEQLASRDLIDPPEQRDFADGDVEGCVLVVAATDDHELNARIATLARAAGALCNVAGGGARSDASIPAAVRRGDLLLAVSTGGASPRLARVLRERLESQFVPQWAELIELIGELRPEIESVPQDRRDDALARAIDGIALAALAGDDARERVRDHLRRELAA